VHLQSVLATLVLSAFVSPLNAAASTITIGGTDYFDGYPYCGCSEVKLLLFQQLYSSTAFPGVEQIDAITYFSTPYGPAPIGGTFTLSLSTTPLGLTQLTTNGASNMGAESAIFSSGTATAGFTFYGTPYTYDPSMGNLLLTVSGRGTNYTTLLAGSNPFTTRVVLEQYETNQPYGGVVPYYGLETQFTVTDGSAVTPEPSSLALAATGLLAFAAVAKRRFA
jgi:hypothetical protein